MFLAFRSWSCQLVLKSEYVKDGKLAIPVGKVQGIDNVKGSISVGGVRMGICLELGCWEVKRYSIVS